MSVYPKTEHGIILLAQKNSAGVFSFLSLNTSLPGVPIRLVMRLPLYEQLTQYVCEHLVPGHSPLALDWWREEILEVSRSEGERENENGPIKFPLFLGISSQETSKPQTSGLHSMLMPEILQNMPKDKNRVAYLKAWQALLGTHKEVLKAIADKDISIYNDEENH